MIQSSSNSNIAATSADFSSTDFSIEVNSSMFQLLTSNIYQDTIAAVIREWSTNAIDSCLEAGIPPKFEAHIPTPSELYFSVRDYGTGLSQTDLVTLFCTLGASTKRDSNLCNGTFGIGRMSGLAYASSFTVQSFYQGHQYTYLISIQDGIPKSILLDSGPTSEPSGLQLTLPVEPQDITKFRDKAEKIYTYFEQKPTLNIELDIDFPSSDAVFESWFVAPYLKHFSSHSNYVLMSNVIYKIDSYDVEDQSFSSIILRVPNGSVTINPGRESLSYDRKTIDYLNQRFLDVKAEYAQFYLDAIEDQTTNFDRLKLLNNALQSSAPREIRSELIKQMNTKYPDLQTYLDMSSSYGGSVYLASSPDPTHINLQTKHSSYANPKPASYQQLNLSHLLDATWLVIDQKTRYSHAYKETQGHVVILSRASSCSLEDFLPKADQWLTSQGISYILSSSIDAPEAESKSEARTASIYASPISSYGRIYASEQINPTATYYYIPLSGTTPVDQTNFEAIYQAHNIVSQAIPNSPRLVGVPKKYISAVESNKNFIPAADLQSRLDTLSFTLKPDVMHPLLAQIPRPTPLMATYTAELKAYNAIPSHLKLSQALVDRITSNGYFKLNCKPFTFSVTVQDIYARYPLYKTIDQAYSYNTKPFHTILQEYIDLMEFKYDTTHQTGGQNSLSDS